MFGTLRLNRNRLDRVSKQAHSRFYCGMCKTLGSEFGQYLRTTLSNDSVFMALFADAFLEKGAKSTRYRCPLLPIRFRAAVEHDSPAMLYGGAIQMLLGDQWLADRAMDGQCVPRLARSLIKSPVSRAQRLLDELGVDLHDLNGFEYRQKDLEDSHPAPAVAAGPTSSAIGLIFQTITDLPGVIPAIRTEIGRSRLYALGSAVGKVIYLTDALEDLDNDQQEGKFNPFLLDGTISSSRLKFACRDLSEALLLIRKLVEQLPLQRHREIVTNILGDRLEEQADKAMDAVSDSGEYRVSPRRSFRLWRPVASAATILLSLFLSESAMASSMGVPQNILDSCPDAGMGESDDDDCCSGLLDS